MDSSLFPFMAKAFNEIFSKIDELTKNIGTLNDNLIKNMEAFNNQIDNATKGIQRVLNTIEQNKLLKDYDAAESKISKYLDELNESSYYINFISALKRILSVVEDIEFT
ncbi:MAG: hypothetical protein EAX96_04855 [Candidatus Lokiarchaeota archaeon]|nr:hypothetical protein [Candidatus Lokiarchaeota archaeon]